MTRIFFHPVTLFVLMYGLGANALTMLIEIVEPILSRPPSVMGLGLCLLMLFLGLVYPMLLGWYVCSISSRPAGPRGSGPTSRIHHPLSLLVFPVMWFVHCLDGFIAGFFFGIDPPDTGYLKLNIVLGFIIWWVVPIEWWALLHRFVNWDRKPRTVAESRVIVRVIGVAREAFGTLGGVERPALPSPPRTAVPTREETQGFDREAFAEVALCVAVGLLLYFRQGFVVGVW